MNTRNLLNIGLALALAGLLALVIYETGKEIPVNKTFLTKLEPVGIQQVIIEQAQRLNIPKQIVLKKTNGQWMMDAPYTGLANVLRINKLLKLTRAISHTQYLVADINLEQLKLSSPDLAISLNDTKLFFGTTDALKGYRYIQTEDTVHLITDRYSHLVRGQATALLSPALLPKNITITKLVLPGMVLQKNDKDWKASPGEPPMTTDQIQQLLDEWRFARALRVSKITEVSNNKSSVIEVLSDKNQQISFNLTYIKDEIILSRDDIGLSYHLAIEAGEKLLRSPSAKSELNNPN